MCGSLLSKFKNSNNQVDPAIDIFPERRCSSQTNDVHQDSACYEDRGFWKGGNENYESSSDVLGTFSSESLDFSESGSSTQSDIEAAVRILDESVRPVLHSTNNRTARLPVMESYINEERMLMKTAREILACQGYAASSSSSAVANQPVSSTRSTLPGKMKTAVAFDIPAGGEKPVCPSGRVPWRLRKRGKVAPELTLQEVREKMRAAEERKLKELERIRDCARSRAGMSSNRVSRCRNKIAAAQIFAKTQQREASSARKMEKIEKKKVKHQQKSDKQNKLKEKHAKVEDKVSFFK